MAETARIYVGVDRSQLLAVKVLEHSIRRHTELNVEVIPMLDFPIREPKDPRNGQRTGFSFSRFCIPKLAGYRGKAIYMDADMLVFKDLRSLWDIPFDGAKVVVQEPLPEKHVHTTKIGAPKIREPQWAVMLLDCSRLDWDVDKIIDGLDAGRYDYDQLMKKFCILKPEEIKHGVPFEWNSVEYFDKDTCLLHYTDVYTQPWTSCENDLAHLWYDEVRLMLKTGALKREEIEREIELGYFRPSLMRDMQYTRFLRPLRSLVGKMNETYAKLSQAYVKMNKEYDNQRNYQPHKEVYAAKRLRKKAIKKYEQYLSSVSLQPDVELLPSEVGRRVIIFTEHVNATYYIGFHYVLQRLSQRGAAGAVVFSQNRIRSTVTEANLPAFVERCISAYRPDTVVFSRYGLPFGRALMEAFHQRGIPLVYHIDDNLIELPVSLGAEIVGRQGNAELVQERTSMLRAADLIYASTPRLEDQLRRKFPGSTIVHGIYAPYMDFLIGDRRVPACRPNGVIRIGYMGSKGHQDDLAMVVPALDRILAEEPRVIFETFGTVRMPRELARHSERVHEHPVLPDYQDFLLYLRNLGWNLGLAPLRNHDFNSCKAPTKFVEYSLCGVPVLASDTNVYQEVVDGQNGRKVSEAEWYTALKNFIDHPEVGSSMVDQARETCRRRFAIEILEKQLMAVLNQARRHGSPSTKDRVASMTSQIHPELAE